MTFGRVYDLKRHVSKHISGATSLGHFCPVSGCKYAVDCNNWVKYFHFCNHRGETLKRLDQRTRAVTLYGLPRKDKIMDHVQRKHSVIYKSSLLKIPLLTVGQEVDGHEMERLLAGIGEASLPVSFKLYRTDVKVDLGSSKADYGFVPEPVYYALQKAFVHPDGTEMEGGKIPLNIVTDSEGRTKAI